MKLTLQMRHDGRRAVISDVLLTRAFNPMSSYYVIIDTVALGNCEKWLNAMLRSLMACRDGDNIRREISVSTVDHL